MDTPAIDGSKKAKEVQRDNEKGDRLANSLPIDQDRYLSL